MARRKADKKTREATKVHKEALAAIISHNLSAAPLNVGNLRTSYDGLASRAVRMHGASLNWETAGRAGRSVKGKFVPKTLAKPRFAPK